MASLVLAEARPKTLEEGGDGKRREGVEEETQGLRRTELQSSRQRERVRMRQGQQGIGAGGGRGQKTTKTFQSILRFLS